MYLHIHIHIHIYVDIDIDIEIDIHWSDAENGRGYDFEANRHILT